MTNVIMGFKGDYRWLSNFERCTIIYKGIVYKSAEAAYQAQKTMDIPLRHIFSKLDAREAKLLGKHIALREDWEDVKLNIMKEICTIKYNLPKFKQLLLTTGNKEIINSTYKPSYFWGVWDGDGENHLGRIIMGIRTNIQKDIKA